MPNIDDYQDKLSCLKPANQRIRDVVAGNDAIKAAGTTYLPLSRDGQPEAEYKRLKTTTTWFPGTSRTARGYKGLMFARNVVLNAPALEPIKEVITNEFASINDMAEEVVWETLQTNWTGLLVDHPERPVGVDLNAQNALDLNYRPFIHIFPFESFLRVEYRLDGPVRKFSRVVLRETERRILELVVEGGVYVQNVWTQEDGKSWEIAEARVPRRDGKPLTEIPLTIVSDNTKPFPQPSVLTDVALLNIDHYIASSRISNLHMFASGVTPVFTGVTLTANENGDVIPPNIHVGKNGIVMLQAENAKAFFLEPEGHVQAGLEKAKDDIQEMMAKCGAAMIASERNKAPESDTVAARRTASEDSTVGMVASESTDQIVARIRGTKANKYSDGILDISRNSAQTMVRTSVNHVSNPPCPHTAVLDAFNTCRWARLWRWPQAIEAGLMYHFRCSKCGARSPRIAPIEAAVTHDWFPNERGWKMLERRLRG